jgi:ankyrin repeat protein
MSIFTILYNDNSRDANRALAAYIRGGYDVNAKDVHGTPLLVAAASMGLFDGVNLLIRANADINLPKSDGYTALMIAIGNGYPDIAGLLIDAKADINTRSCTSGRTALTLAQGKGYVHLVNRLVKPTKPSLLHRLFAFSSPQPAHEVSGKRPDTTPAASLTQAVHSVPAVDSYLPKEVDTAEHMDEIKRRLFAACQRGDVEDARALLDQGANPNVNDGSATLLGRTLQNNNRAVALLLLDRGADPKAADPNTTYRYSPLHWAAEQGATEVAKRLIEKGADVDARTRNGFTPLRIAELTRNTAVADLLKIKGGKSKGPR